MQSLIEKFTWFIVVFWQHNTCVFIIISCPFSPTFFLFFLAFFLLLSFYVIIFFTFYFSLFLARAFFGFTTIYDILKEFFLKIQGFVDIIWSMIRFTTNSFKKAKRSKYYLYKVFLKSNKEYVFFFSLLSSDSPLKLIWILEEFRVNR